jgi:outer membrane protein assembly factor BamB
MRSRGKSSGQSLFQKHLPLFQSQWKTAWCNVGGGALANNHGVLYALKARTGATVWKSTLPTDNSFEMQTDPIYADGMIFGTWNDGYLRAFDATTGKQLWSQLTLSNYSSAAVANGLVYVGSDAFDGAQYLYAFHEKTGKLAWKTETLSDARIGSAPAVANGVVYVSDIENKQLHAYNATTGNLLWSFSVLEGNAQDSPAIANGPSTSPRQMIISMR